MDSSSFTLSDLPLRWHLGMPKRLFSYLILQILVGFAFFSLVSFLPPLSTFQLLATFFFIFSLSNLYGLSQKHKWAYYIEYFRLLLGFLLVLFVTGSVDSFNKILFGASMLVFVSFLWLKIIKTVFGK